mmetsp:Transcript_75972/g.195731  ORF Transcript_75972/g.195731 Transcript_75972/m.195731 type:complete len:317 (+) Transcript_75972:1215-2165(+)
MHVVAVHVVRVTVLHVAMWVDRVPGHRDLGPIEDGGLVHVIPDVGVRVRARVLVQCELRAPIVAHLRVCEVWVQGGARPAPPFEVGHRRARVGDLSRLPRALVIRVRDLGRLPHAILLLVPDLRRRRRRVRNLLQVHPVGGLHVSWIVHHLPVELLDELSLVTDLLVDVEVLLLLDMRIDNVDELAALRRDGVGHLVGRGEIGRVPREVSLTVGVLDVKPDDIVWDVVLVVARIHCGHVLLAHVVPAALVLAQRPEWWHGCSSGEVVELPGDARRAGPHKDHSVDHPALAGPPRVRGADLRIGCAAGRSLKLHEGL